MWVIFDRGKWGFTGSVLFLVIVYICEPWMARRSFADGLRLGLLWVVLTLAFEWNFGRYVVGRLWESIAAEYNLSHGGGMPVGLAIFAMTPWSRHLRIAEGRLAWGAGCS